MADSVRHLLPPTLTSITITTLIEGNEFVSGCQPGLSGGRAAASDGCQQPHNQYLRGLLRPRAPIYPLGLIPGSRLA